ncbi:phosphatase PAP2 family protein [Allosphingosinicella vermicomposti]|uniref:phosphatase PAP2 family protein n=1 Tax=Allosphingosinicella vermicomposti TaxID=614671 RepID=UPI001FE1D94D|nr:phosphatase PAP2 family protein [Allosphingosinicella vermicomposti]
MTLPVRLAVTGISLALFLAMLLAGGSGWRWDEGVYLFLYGDPRLAAPARFVTELGGWKMLVPAAFLGSAALFAAHRRRDAAILLAMTMGGRLLVWLMKEVVARPRPALEDHLVAVGSASFPSGHGANGLITWLALALLIPRKSRAVAITAALILAFLIGLSRVVLGVHWPSDVIAGWAIGLIWTGGLAAIIRGKSARGPS